MSWSLAQHDRRGLKLGSEDRGRYHRTAGWVPDKSNNLVFFSFAMVPMYIYLENLENRLNTMRLALCLAMGSDRIIAKQGNSLLRLSLNWYVMTQIVYVYHFYQSQFTLFWHIFGGEVCRFEKSPKFFTLWHLKKYNNCHDNLISQFLKFIKNNVVITIRQLYLGSTIAIS